MRPLFFAKNYRTNLTLAIALSVLAGFVLTASAQSGRRPVEQPTPIIAPKPIPPKPSDNPNNPTPVGDNDTVKIVTEEVRIPLFVSDRDGRREHFLEPSEVMVFEDDVMQEVRSVQRFPAYVALLLDTNGVMNPAMRTSSTRDIALALLKQLPTDDYVSVIQSGRKVEIVQHWTTEAAQTEHALKTKLIGGSTAYFSDAMMLAATLFADTPSGNRHLVIVTDGAETPGSKTRYADVVQKLNETGATVHIISYAALGTEELIQRINGQKILTGARPNAGTIARQADPTMPGIPSNQKGGTTIDLDRELRKRRRAYIADMQRGSKKLATLAQDTGGEIIELEEKTPFTAAGQSVARDIGTQYVITYRPLRPLSTARPGEFRRLNVALRRPEVTVRTRRGYVAAPLRNDE